MKRIVIPPAIRPPALDPFPSLSRYGDYHRARMEGRWALLLIAEREVTKYSHWQDMSDDLRLAATPRTADLPGGDDQTHVEGDSWITANRMALRAILSTATLLSSLPTQGVETPEGKVAGFTTQMAMIRECGDALQAIGETLIRVEAPPLYKNRMSPPMVTDHLFRYMQGLDPEGPCPTCDTIRQMHRG